MSTCYVLEGGAMRGNFTGGVLDFLCTRRMPYPDCVIGVSAGAICGTSYCSGQVGRAVRVNTTYCTNPRFLSMRSFLRSGDAFGTHFAFDKVQNELDPFDYRGYAERPMEFWVVCTNVETGMASYHRIDEMPRDADYIRASASMPVVSRMVKRNGEKLLDGGTADSIPVHWALEHGYDRIVVILTRSRSYVKQPVSEREMRMVRFNYAEYPAYCRAIHDRHIIYNRTRNEVFEMEREGRIFVFAPIQPMTVKTMENRPEAIMEIYDEGWNLARDRMDELKEYLGI